MEISEEWLLKRAEEELNKIGEKSLSKFEYLRTSNKIIEENRSEIIKHSAKIEFIKEIMEQAKKQTNGTV